MNNEMTLGQYQTEATKTAIYPGQGTPIGLAYVALKMNGEAGEFAEHVGKAMRDDQLITMSNESSGSTMGPVETRFRILLPARKDLLIKEVGDVLWYLSAACNELGISLEEAAAANLAKLKSRAERNAIHGSGDNR